MIKNNDSSIKSIIKSYSPRFQNHDRSIRQPRESQTSEASSCFRKMNNSVNRGNIYYKQDNYSSRVSRKSSNQPKSSNKYSGKTNIERVLSQFKEQYAHETKSSRYNNLVRTKSEHNLNPLFAYSKLPVSKSKDTSEERCKSSISELQSKLAQYNKGKLNSVKSQSQLIQMKKSPQKNNKLSQKTQKCRQLCLQIKRKLFKETVSTTASDTTRKNLSISDFVLHKMIGQGKFSKVYIARHKKSGIILAIKIIKKQTIKKESFVDQLVREIKIQSFLNHVNIVKIYSFFQDKLNVYLLLQYCEGGQLYDIFKVKSKLKQEEWRPIMKAICQGLYELHRFSVIHRDLKPQNIVLSFGIAKIGDFGWSVHNAVEKRDTFCGTPLYISPQLLLGNSYDKQVDIWALGVMMYEFLTGRIPFKISQERNLLQIVNSNIVYPKFLTKQCVNLLTMILQKDPGARIGILDILEHHFLKENAFGSHN